MRTGAIFARGSCRALKWTALFGVVLALGTGQALAQTLEGTYAPGSMTIEVELTGTIGTGGDLYAQGDVASTFALTNGPTGVTVSSTTLPGSRTTATSNEFTLTLSGPLESTPATGNLGTLTAARVSLTYTPTAANRIIELGATAADDQPVTTATDAEMVETDIPPTLVPVPAQTLIVGQAADVQLPEAGGGNTPTITYALTTQSVDVPGLTFNATTRKLMGTPTTVGTYTLYYEATDNNANLAAAEVDATVDNEVISIVTITVAADTTIDRVLAYTVRSSTRS